MPSSGPDPAGAAPVEIGLGLGSNIGDKPANIRRALDLLEARKTVEIVAISSIYRTAPWGYLDQDAFANACALARTRLSPAALLAEAKAIEAEMGREKTIRWGPRLIDIDILFYGDLPLAEPDLILPHKELFNRAFVLVPLAEIAPELRVGGRLVREAAAELNDGSVRKWEPE
ncbi:2-amino-4-hydroxy-6-hydroxymethyldihydropteridine diphosphokinase [Methyloferula stellata]|uniref:2-amino-4-hydroxy-6- hydroxymethyldihydropteridine diphosphokinase n=1 Tax=Methyloferula stellata TaxID=876270 RepID=UPI000365ED22|nr:2-amino-4-hydroxy-6-hydroxymethyldihydropteridine diphosphokinase [Methyloferula stellata]